MRNWSHTVTYAAREVARPTSLAELQEVVAGAERVRALGSRHSFSEVADTTGTHVLLDAMPGHVEVAEDRSAVTSDGGLTHSELSLRLDAEGLALPNLASLPHISVAGAIQTGTHGSGVTNPALSANVVALEVVDAAGELRTVRAGDPDFDAVVVGLGAFGVLHRVTQRVVPAFEVAQTIHQDLTWDALLPRFEDVMASAYSVSLFTTYDGPAVEQVWRKHRLGDPDPAERADLDALGAHEATRTLHPLPHESSENVTAQRGVPGPSHERLPHFRHGFKPSAGEEIQSEFLLDAAHAVEAIEALRALAPGFAPHLFIAEIRRVAADQAWLSPSGGRDSVALHFTWHRDPEAVLAALVDVEAALVPLGARPHWGKRFVTEPADLRAAYPRFGDYADAVAAWDPAGRFGNAFTDRLLGVSRRA